MTHKEELIKIVTSDKSFKKTCDKVSRQYSDDIFQEVCEQILVSKEEKLPAVCDLKFWFWRVASNLISKKGRIGKYLSRERDNNYAIDSSRSDESEDHKEQDGEIEKLAKTMIELTEFENRVIHLYVELGSMKRVERATGLSYSSLRVVKDKIKKIQ